MEESDIEDIEEELEPGPEAEPGAEIDQTDGVGLIPEIDGEPEEQGLTIYDPLQRFLAEVRKYPFLSREEEKRLAIKFKEEGDLQAVTQLVLSHLRLVVSIAMEYKNLPFNTMDLIQEGNVGLMQGIKKFDPYKDIRVSTYATWWIRAYILKYILQNWRLVRIGTTEAQRKLFFRLSKERERLEKMGYEAGPKLLADRLDVKEKEVIEMEQRLGGREHSLDEPVGAESDETLANILPSDQEPADERLANDELRDLFQAKLKEFSKTLKPRELEILQDRILSEHPKTLDVFGKKYSISKERVRQLEENLIKKLKQFMKENIKDFKDIGPL
ncbi:MAG: RNA polymerase factor sigma-32 [Nitrospirae bacterium]|nr:RNA polymerase factor sigma-32 [Candidatus Manganitrophaceae bacterium]